MNELSSVLSFLRSKSIGMTLNNEWLKECSQYYISTNTSRSGEELRNFVYEQWLLADLSEIGEQCLPRHLLNSPKCRLEGNYAVQVNEMLDIGESCYSQLRHIRSSDTISSFCEIEEKVPTWHPKRNRTLKLCLTDGTVNLLALEFEPVVVLREPFIPGLKILLLGPIECRRGVLLLKSGSVEVLGGEVDCLLVCNALENVLARKLNLAENPNPLAGMASLQATDDGLAETESDVELDNYLQDFENSMNRGTDPNDGPVPRSAPGPSSRGLETSSLNHSNQRNNAPVSRDVGSMNHGFQNSAISVPSNNFISSSRDMRDPVVDPRYQRKDIPSVSNMFNVNSRDLANSSITCRNQSTSVPAVGEQRTSLGSYSRMDDSGNFSADFRNESNLTPVPGEQRTLDTQGRINQYSNWPQSSTSTNRREKSPIVGVVTPITSNKRVAESPPHHVDTKSWRTDLLSPSHPTILETRTEENLTSLQQVQNIMQLKSPCTVECLLKVNKILHKPRIKNEQWLVSIEVMDETGQLHVRIDDEFLQDEVFPISVCEIKALKDRIATNPAVKTQIDDMIRTGIMKILSLQGRFHLRILPDHELPVVMKVS